MKITYDPAVNALYVRASRKRVVRTVEVRPDVYVDLDKTGQPVGFEFLNVRAIKTEQQIVSELPSQQEILAAAS